MKARLFLLIPLTMFGLISMSAQTTSKSEQAIYTLMESGFLQSYKDYRSESEQYAGLFKARKGDYTVEDLVKMKSAYKRTAEAFERFIHITRNDLLDKKKRKEIRKKTESYVERRLIELERIHQEYYMGRLYPTYASICEGRDMIASSSKRRTGIPPEIPVALLAPVARATMDVIDYFDKKGDKNLEYLKEVLEEEWVKPNLFKPWEEI